MFFLKLEGKDLERLLKFAADRKGTSVERLARLAFLKGLRLLVKADADTIATEMSAEKQPYKRRKLLEESQAYIRENWQQQTDEQMGEALGYGWGHVRRIRLDLGLQRPKGRYSRSISGAAQEHRALSESVSQERWAQLDTLIREHWETKNDAEIGRLMTPPYGRISVIKRRLELGLQRQRGVKRTSAIREVIDAEEFERMILREGYTMPDYIRHKGLLCTRERVRQIVQEMGLKYLPEDRSPEWELVRKARNIGNLNLANREWLAQQVATHQSMSTLAAELKVTDADLFFFIRAFKFTHPWFRKHGAQTVDLVCTNCDTKFSRLRRWVDKRLSNANGRPVEFFCSQKCTGQWNRERVRRSNGEKSAKQRERERFRKEKSEREAAFIRENWETMPDVDMASALELSESTIAHKRQVLGLSRLKS